MIYHKYKVDERTTVINELYEDEIVTFCGDCNKEIGVTLDDICHINMEGADFSSTTFFCAECSKKRSGAS